MQPLAERCITCSEQSLPYASFYVCFVGQLTLQLCRRVHVLSIGQRFLNPRDSVFVTAVDLKKSTM